MWTALGIGVLCIFMATMLPTDHFIPLTVPVLPAVPGSSGHGGSAGGPLLYCGRVRNCSRMCRRDDLYKSQEVICMNIFTLTAVEFKKIRRSKIILILAAATFILWFPNVLNADLNFDMNDIGISPENSFFIQGFMGMAWFIYPAGHGRNTVILVQTERTNRGILKMLTLPVCTARFSVLPNSLSWLWPQCVCPVHDCRILYRHGFAQTR